MLIYASTHDDILIIMQFSFHLVINICNHVDLIIYNLHDEVIHCAYYNVVACNLRVYTHIAQEVSIACPTNNL